MQTPNNCQDGKTVHHGALLLDHRPFGAVLARRLSRGDELRPGKKEGPGLRGDGHLGRARHLQSEAEPGWSGRFVDCAPF